MAPVASLVEGSDMRRHQLVVGLAALLLVMVMGCGTAETYSPDEFQLQDIGLAYQKYQAENKKPPPTALDLVPYVAEATAKKLVEGKFIINANAPLQNYLDGKMGRSDRIVLGYDKDVPEKGGFVLMVNMTVQKVTADQFKTLPQVISAK